MGNLWAKLKLIWKGRAIATDLINIKGRWKSVGFWATLLANGGTLIASIKGIMPPEAAIMVNAGITALYNYLRGIEKAQTDGVKPFKSSSEFIFGLLTMVNNAFIDMQTGGVATGWMAAANVWIGHAIAANRDMSNMRPKEVAAAGVK
jgi:hypothetical protein